MVAVFVAQISHHHWNKNAGTTVDDSHDASLHLGIIWEQMLLCCQLFFSQSHVVTQLVSSAFSVALFQNFPGSDAVREVINFGSLRRRQDFPAVVQTPPSCSWVIESSQSSPLFQTWFSFSSSDNLQSFSFRPRYQEIWSISFVTSKSC